MSAREKELSIEEQILEEEGAGILINDNQVVWVDPFDFFDYLLNNHIGIQRIGDTIYYRDNCSNDYIH